MPNLQATNIPIHAGDIIKVMAHFAQPPKEKILICVCPIRFKYLVVSTDPYLLAPTAQLRVTPQEVRCLSHDSHIDTSKLITLSAMETQYIVDADPQCHKGRLSATVRQSIKALILQHGIMPNDQMTLIGTNL
jgi:hypothetical protein